MRRAAFLRRMASVALAGMLGVRLEMSKPAVASAQISTYDELVDAMASFRGVEPHSLVLHPKDYRRLRLLYDTSKAVWS